MDYSIPTEHLLRIPEDEYHTATRHGEFLSSHMLAAFRRSPMFYYRKLKGYVVEKKSAAYELGTAVHKMILEGVEAFNREYFVTDGPINPKTGNPYGKQTKAFEEWASTIDKKIISYDDMAFVERLFEAVFLNAEANDLLSQGVAERTLRTHYAGMPCQIRADWINPARGIIDLKTTQDLDWFESDARRYGYIYQLAFYRSIFAELTNVIAPVYIIAVEKDEPYRAGVWKIASDVLDQAEAVNREAIRRLRNCYNTGDWPTGFEEPRIITEL